MIDSIIITSTSIMGNTIAYIVWNKTSNDNDHIKELNKIRKKHNISIDNVYAPYQPEQNVYSVQIAGLEHLYRFGYTNTLKAFLYDARQYLTKQGITDATYEMEHLPM